MRAGSQTITLPPFLQLTLGKLHSAHYGYRLPFIVYLWKIFTFQGNSVHSTLCAYYRGERSIIFRCCRYLRLFDSVHVCLHSDEICAKKVIMLLVEK